jgi:hypothetical protein
VVVLDELGDEEDNGDIVGRHVRLDNAELLHDAAHGPECGGL